MDRAQRRDLAPIVHEVAEWKTQADEALSARASLTASAAAITQRLQRRLFPSGGPAADRWSFLALANDDIADLRTLASHRGLQPLAAGEVATLEAFNASATPALHDAQALSGSRRFFAGPSKRSVADRAAAHLSQVRDWGLEIGLPDLLQRAWYLPDVRGIGLNEALSPTVGLVDRLSDVGPARTVIALREMLPAREAVLVIRSAAAGEASLRAAALEAGSAVRKAEAWRMVEDMPVSRLRDATRERIRVTSLEEAGIETVQQVLQQRQRLTLLPGIGSTTAVRMEAAATALWQHAMEEAPVRIDIARRTPDATALLRALSAWDAYRKALGTRAQVIALMSDLKPLLTELPSNTSHVLAFGPAGRDLRKDLDTIASFATHLRRVRAVSPPEPWADFLARPADYFALLAELGLITEDEVKSHGDLPQSIVDAVRNFALDAQYLKASLRGYQAFGAKFALVQKKVIIGDEMGLGKTVEALATLAHLRAIGNQRFLVIAPAAVVTNWMREIADKTHLTGHRIHGTYRASAVRAWTRHGGVGVTTFETLRWLRGELTGDDPVAAVIVDEAHYIKNPDAQRTRLAREMIRQSQHAILLTGTPLENRLSEFANMVSYLRPDLVVDSEALSSKRFRAQVAPAYIRRNQEDVLSELPERVEVEEWLPMSGADHSAYANAVYEGNFMAMRQAAMLSGPRSEKLQRLLELVEEAEKNGRRVIVFSQFRAVLDAVAQALPGPVFGPLTGSVPAGRRQEMVDGFSASRGGAVLVSQIEAGGVGLNIQAASVVIICEPQLKPTTEWQAIARAARMGQLQSVQVHRLLSEDGVDLRITEILAAKKELFEEFARDSDTARSTVDALDISEAKLRQEVLEAERARMFGRQPFEKAGDTAAAAEVSTPRVEIATPVDPEPGAPVPTGSTGTRDRPGVRDRVANSTTRAALVDVEVEEEFVLHNPPVRTNPPTQRLELVAQSEVKVFRSQQDLPFEKRDGFMSGVMCAAQHAALYKANGQRKVWFELVPEPTNPVDRAAVMVYLNGVRAGYLRSHLARQYQGQIEQLNARGLACFVPGRCEFGGGDASASVALPLRDALTTTYGLDEPSWAKRRREARK